MKTCTIPDCGSEVFARGWCCAHWKRWRRHADPLAGGTPHNLTLAERLALHVEPQPDTGCIHWTGGNLVRGYGRIRVTPSRFELAHRVAYELRFGPIPAGLFVLHRCDNPLCVNPDHLFPGTHADNMRDMVAKNRAADARGEKNPRAKLTAPDVQVIRASAAPLAALAAQYGLALEYVRQIQKRKSWRHL